jgi:hypothetical protein
MKPTKTYTFKCHGTWTLECNPSEVYPNDPGMGTPLLVIAPNGETSTLACTMSEGVISGDDQSVPAPVMRWLAEIEGDAEVYVYGEQS